MKTRLPHWVFQEGPYSPTDVAQLLGPNFGRTRVYQYISDGLIETTKDEHGRMQITGKALADFLTRVTPGRAGGLANVAKHGGKVVAVRMRIALERRVDPEGTLDPEERARLVKVAQDAQLAKARAAKRDKRPST